MRNICGHAQCKDYCIVQYYYEEHSQFSDILNLKYSQADVWKNGKWMPEKTFFQFCGVGLHLNPDGTYELEDTTGG